MVIFMFELKRFLQLQLKGSHTKTQKNTVWGENVLLNFFTKHTFSLFGLINAHFRPKTSNHTSKLLHFVVSKVLVWLKLISSTFLAFNFYVQLFKTSFFFLYFSHFFRVQVYFSTLSTHNII